MRSPIANLLLLALVLPSMAYGACPDRSGGIGGTGRTEESGIGGTGLSAGDDKEGGVGGTGLSTGPDGIGGTGVMGEIIGFGSICVNGLEIHYTDDTPVTQNGAPATPSSLSVGQIVSVEATGTGPDLTARSIHVVPEMTGPISRPLDGGVMEVGGHPVHVPPGATIAGQRALGRDGMKELKPGTVVQVHGLRRADHSVQATRIEVVAPESPSFVREPGPLQFGASSGRVIVEGLVHDKARNSTLVVGGLPYRIEGRTLPDGTDLASLSVNDRVRLNAIRREDGSFHVERIERSERGDDARRSDTSKDSRGSSDVRTDERAERAERSDRTERAERSERVERPERAERTERVERPERAERTERPERVERVDRVERVERVERTERPERVERTERPERAERPDRTDR